MKIVTDVAAATPEMAETIGDEKVGWIYNPATARSRPTPQVTVLTVKLSIRCNSDVLLPA